MLKSMGKKKLLTLVAVMAVAVTVMGSFAIWDSLEATNTSNEVSLRNPVTVEAGNFTLSAEDTALNVAPKISGPAVFNTSNYDKTTMKFTPEVEIYKGETKVTTSFDIDTSATETYDDSAKTITYPVTATVRSDTDPTTLAGESITVKVKGTISKR